MKSIIKHSLAFAAAETESSNYFTDSKMLSSRLPRPEIIVRDTTVTNLTNVFSSLRLCHRRPTPNPQLVLVRHATHAAQGRANGPKDSAGRRLGAKKTASQYVIPGNIIFKQRGTKWFPGENVGIGKDHTIYATVAGYVRYYRNPAVHPKRRYIGVALEKEGPGSKLPSPANAPTRRRLGMFVTPIESNDQQFLEAHLSNNSKPLTTKEVVAVAPTFRSGQYWESNYEIGKAAEKKGIQVRDYDRKDRWLAWRKRSKKVKEQMLAKAAKATRKAKGKKTNKGAVRRK